MRLSEADYPPKIEVITILTLGSGIVLHPGCIVEQFKPAIDASPTHLVTTPLKRFKVAAIYECDNGIQSPDKKIQKRTCLGG